MPTGGIDVTSKRRRHLTYRANNGILERIHYCQCFAQRLCVVCPKMPIAIQSLISNIGIATQLLGPFVEARLIKLAYSPQGCEYLNDYFLLLLLRLLLLVIVTTATVTTDTTGHYRHHRPSCLGPFFP